MKPDPDAPEEEEEKAPSQDLPVYTEQQLSQMKKKELLADAEYLDGMGLPFLKRPD